MDVQTTQLKCRVGRGKESLATPGPVPHLRHEGGRTGARSVVPLRLKGSEVLVSSDLVARNGAVVRANSREVRALQKQTTLVVTREDAEALVRDVRIRNAYQLAHHTVDRAAILNRVVTEISHDNPGLEMMLRSIEREVGLQAGDLIADYLRR
jgi:hypothetical protein